jgi:hypothetical protein
MLGYREPMALGRGHTPTWRQPPLSDRLGIGPPMPREPICHGWLERWSETLSLELTIAASSIEATWTRYIHQPFRVRSINMINHAATPTDVYWSIQPDPGPAPAGGADYLTPRSLTNIQREGTSDQTLINLIGRTPLTPNTIIRSTPIRLRLAAFNGGASAQIITIILDLTYLAPREPED